MPVVVTGLKELIQGLRELELNIPQELANAGYTSMVENVENVAKQRCPVDTGYLRATIHTEIETTAPQVIVTTGSGVTHAPFVEYGTGKYATGPGGSKAKKIPWMYFYSGHKGKKGMRLTYGQPPQPFLKPAFEMNKNRIPETVARHIETRISKELTKLRNRAVAGYYGGIY